MKPHNNLPTKRVFALFLPLGSLYADGGTGALIEPLDESILRLEALLAAIPNDPETVVFAVSGCQRFNCATPTNDIRVSLAEQMLRFFLEHRHERGWRHTMYANPVAWGSTQLAAVVEMMTHLHAVDPRDNDVEIWTASHSDHLDRVGRDAKSHIPPAWKFTALDIGKNLPEGCAPAESWKNLLHGAADKVYRRARPLFRWAHYTFNKKGTRDKLRKHLKKSPPFKPQTIQPES